MKKIYKFALILLSTLGLILGTTSTSFSKVEGDKIILSPSTFENDVEAVPKISPIVERRTNVNLIILFIIFPY